MMLLASTLEFALAAETTLRPSLCEVNTASLGQQLGDITALHRRLDGTGWCNTFGGQDGHTFGGRCTFLGEGDA